MEKILISACLIGEKTRYDGGDNRVAQIDELLEYYELVPFCPEVEGGLSTPRAPAEIYHDQVRTQEGKDLTSIYVEAAKKAYSLCQFLGIRVAILKEKSPACGVHVVHNGLFDGRLVKGMGFTARYLKSKGIEVYSEEELPTFLEGRKAREEKRNAFLERQAQYLEEHGDEAPREPKPFRSTHNKQNSFEGKEGGYGKDRPSYKDRPHSHRPKREDGDGAPSASSRDFSTDRKFRKDTRGGFHKGGRPFKKDGFKKDGFRKDGEFKKSYSKDGEFKSDFHKDGEFKKPYRKDDGFKKSYRKEGGFHKEGGYKKDGFKKPYAKKDGYKPRGDFHKDGPGPRKPDKKKED